MESSLTDNQALPTGSRLEEFVIERVLGSGGFGITYLATDTSLGRKVVIKENLPSQFAWRETASGTVRPRHSTGGDIEDYQWSMQNFLREAETLASLDHPGIVRVLRKFETNGTAYFVMPFVEGVPFDGVINDRIDKGKSFTQDELLGLTTRMLDALGYLNDRGIYHRDIKPANILITSQGVPVLIDFGSARQHLSERSMTVIESAGYTPFEQLQSRGNVGPWSDLYALGATLAKAVTFETPPKAADRIMGDPWQGLATDPWTASYSDWFLKAIDRAMAVDPTHRWQHAKEWSDFLGSGKSSPTPVSLVQVRPAIPENQPPHILSERKVRHEGNPFNGPASGLQKIQAKTTNVQSGNLARYRSWQESCVASHCPHCGQRLRFQVNALKKSMIKCPSCGKGIVPSALTELHPEEATLYSVSLAELLFSYKGRVGRKAYWLVSILPSLAFVFIGAVLLESRDTESVGGFFMLLWLVWSAFVCMPITAKRLHDHDMSGHFMWLMLIPYINGIVSIWFLVRLGMMPGKDIVNKYGPPISQIITPLGK